MKGIERHWALVLILTVVVVGLVFLGNSRVKSTAIAGTKISDNPGSNTFAVPIQLSRDNYGLAMFDVSAKTVWIYEFSNRGPAQTGLRLLAARSYQFDALLTDYNTSPRPKEIMEMLESLSRSDKLPQNPEEELEENRLSPKRFHFSSI